MASLGHSELSEEMLISWTDRNTEILTEVPQFSLKEMYLKMSLKNGNEDVLSNMSGNMSNEVRIFLRWYIPDHEILSWSL